jgi:hypothetical protein
MYWNDEGTLKITRLISLMVAQISIVLKMLSFGGNLEYISFY